MKDNGPKRITLMSLASESGVSHTSVSAALRGKGNISKKLRERILELARKQGYTPHVAGQMLRSKTSGYLGLIIGGENPIQSAESGNLGPMLGAFLNTCEETNQKYHVEFYRSRKKQDSPAPLHLANSSVDGVILAGFVDARLTTWLKKEAPGRWVSVEEPAPYAFLSAIDQGMSSAVHHLYGLGHRHFAFFGWDQDFIFHRLSIRGYTDACRQLGIPEEKATVSLVPDSIPYESYTTYLVEQARSLLAPGKNPTAIVCQGFDIARVIHLVLAEFGLNIPRDVSLMAAGPKSIAVQSFPRISFIRPDYGEMMKGALATLKQLVAGATLPPRTISIPTQLVHLESTGPAPVR